MSDLLLVARHEWRRLAMQPFAWSLAALLMALMAWQFLLGLQGFLDVAPRLGGLADAPGATDLIAIPLLRSLSNLLLLLVPLVTMRSFAGERRAGTLPLLLASGLGNGRIVLGKFTGALGYVLALVALVLLMPLALGLGSTPDYGKLAAAFAGVALFAAALTAIGVLCSAWAAQPALAAAAALAAGTLLAIVDAGARLEGIHNDSINYLALGTHLEPFFRGIVASVDIVYFLLVTGVALVLAARRLDALRTRPD